MVDEWTHVRGRVLLLSARDGAAALGGVEGGLALDGRLTLGGAGAADFAADLGDRVPVVAHFVGGKGGKGGGGVVWVVTEVG